MSKYINIVLTADNNYTKVIGVLMYSILKNLSKDKIAKFYIFSYKFSSKDIKELEKLKEKFNFEIIYIRMEDYIDIFDFANEDRFRNRWITIACYFRLLIFKILPDDIEECFYIDSDMIVDCDLSELKLKEDKMFLACIEPGAMQDKETHLSYCYKLEEFKNFSKEPEKYPYFNAGFFLVNLKKAREHDIWNQIVVILNKYPSLPYCDQDVLNIIFGQMYSDLIQFAPTEYNVFTNISYREQWNNVPLDKNQLLNNFYNPKIYHYAGKHKPWDSVDVKHYNHIWWKYCKKTPWKNLFYIYFVCSIINNKFISKMSLTCKLLTGLRRYR